MTGRKASTKGKRAASAKSVVAHDKDTDGVSETQLESPLKKVALQTPTKATGKRDRISTTERTPNSTTQTPESPAKKARVASNHAYDRTAPADNDSDVSSAPRTTLTLEAMEIQLQTLRALVLLQHQHQQAVASSKFSQTTIIQDSVLSILNSGTTATPKTPTGPTERTGTVQEGSGVFATPRRSARKSSQVLPTPYSPAWDNKNLGDILFSGSPITPLSSDTRGSSSILASSASQGSEDWMIPNSNMDIDLKAEVDDGVDELALYIEETLPDCDYPSQDNLPVLPSTYHATTISNEDQNAIDEVLAMDSTRLGLKSVADTNVSTSTQAHLRSTPARTVYLEDIIPSTQSTNNFANLNRDESLVPERWDLIARKYFEGKNIPMLPRVATRVRVFDGAAVSFNFMELSNTLGIEEWRRQGRLIMTSLSAQPYAHFANPAFCDPGTLSIRRLSSSHYLVPSGPLGTSNYSYMLSPMLVDRSYTQFPDTKTRRRGVAARDVVQFYERKLGLFGLKSNHTELFHREQYGEVQHYTTFRCDEMTTPSKTPRSKAGAPALSPLLGNRSMLNGNDSIPVYDMRSLKQWDTQQIITSLPNFRDVGGSELPIGSVVMICYTVSFWGEPTEGSEHGNGLNLNVIWMGLLALPAGAQANYPSAAHVNQQK